MTDHAAQANGVSTRFLTSSNLLSLLRALLAIPFVAIMLSDIPNARFWGAVIIALAALTDKLDGMLARRFNEITVWGKILDPLADKVGVAAVAVVLLLLGELPLWFALALLARDLLILAGGIYVRTKYGLVLASNLTGKWTIAVVAITLFSGVLGLPSPWLDILVVLSTVMLLLSLAAYAMRFMQVLRAPRGEVYGNS